MIDYQETIERMEELLKHSRHNLYLDEQDAGNYPSPTGQKIIEMAEEEVQSFGDAITLLQHYREGLEGIKCRQHCYSDINGCGAAQAARKTLEGPK